MLRASTYSILLRTVALVGKFGLVLYLGRFLTPAAMGRYGLLLATINLAIYALGFEFHAFNTRQIVRRERPPALLLRDQMIVHGGLYLLVLPAIAAFVLFGLLPAELLGWIYVLLVLEHLSQEAYRVFTAIERPITANVVLTLRTGAWVYVVVTLGLLDPGTRDFTTVLAGWTAGAGGSVLLAGVLLGRWIDWRPVREAAPDWQWMRRGLRHSLYFLGAVISLKSIQYADRFFIEHFHGTELVGAYTLYASIANAIQTFVFTGVVMIVLPKLVSSYHEERREAYETYLRQLRLGGTGGAVLLAIGGVLGMPLLLRFLKDPLYGSYLTSYWILMAAAVVFVMAMVPHYGLYVRKLDREIFLPALVAMICNLLANALLVPGFGLVGAALGTAASAVLLLVGKHLALRFTTGQGAATTAEEPEMREE